MASTDVMEQHDLMGIGRHCNAVGCSQLDFLPFKCSNCNGTFCLEHRLPGAHQCKHAGKGEVSTVICPICARAIKLVGGEDPNEAFERHSRSSCDPSNYKAVHNKAKCPVSGCKEKLAASNKYRCKECHQEVCMKHRFPADHQCKGRTTAAPSAWSTMLSSAVWTSARTSTVANNAGQQRPTQALNQAASSGSAAGTRTQQQQQGSSTRSTTAAKWTDWWSKRIGK